MKPYHPNNIKLTGQPYWRMVVLAWAGKLLGIQFKADGLPFGGKYRGPASDSGPIVCGRYQGLAGPHDH